MTTPKDDETNLLNSFAQATGDVPLLNRPSIGRTSLTGYRKPELVSEAVAYVNSLESIPDGDPEKLNEGWDGQGTIPSEKLRRGLTELLTESFLENIYPEWIGDAMDDAYACMDALHVLTFVKEYGWGRFIDFCKSDEAPPSFQLPEQLAKLFPFKDEDED